MSELTQFPTIRDLQDASVRLKSNGNRLALEETAVEEDATGNLTQLLEMVRRTLLNGNRQTMSRTLDEFGEKLNDLRQGVTPEAWQEMIDAGRNHPLFLLALENPLIRRAFDKPRGYPGDAVLIDFIYGAGNYALELEQATTTGRDLYLHSRMTTACQGVRNRRDILANEIGETLVNKDGARILSVAAGHLREADQIPWNAVRDMDLFLALDQDLQSLSEIAAQNYHPNLVAEEVTVRQILGRKMNQEDFDLIYVAGLYDYLTDLVAVRLTEILFSKLRPNGKLLVANFMPSLTDIGWMEMFMDWHLIYRDEEQVAALAKTLPADELLSSRTYLESSGQICFLEMFRR